MKDVVYKKETYQISNNFFPFRIQEIKKWEIADKEINKSLLSAQNRFVAEWLNNESLSKNADEVLTAAKKLYKFYFEHFNELNTGKYKIRTWDAGWWQIRNALVDQTMGKELIENIKIEHGKLKEKILPQIYEYGFLTY